MRVQKRIKELVEDVVGGPPFRIGDKVKHPDGRMVLIVDGQYWGDEGLSNHWTWQAVLENGNLGKKEYGYGWIPT